MTTPAKVLDAIFPQLGEITPEAAAQFFPAAAAAKLEPLVPMSGLHYACLERLDHILTSRDDRLPNMLEYATAYLLLRLRGVDAHTAVCASNGASVLAAAAMEMLEALTYAAMPQLASAVNAALVQATALAPTGGDGGDEQSPLPVG